jgi:hypothetical protein
MYLFTTPMSLDERHGGNKEASKVAEKLTCGVQGIDINAQIHWFLRPNPVPNLLDNSRRPNAIHLSRLHYLKPAITVILIVRRT